MLIFLDVKENPEVIEIPDSWMAAVGALDDSNFGWLYRYRFGECLQLATVWAIGKGLPCFQRFHDLRQKSLIIHISARHEITL
ncbi:MAG: hypothetical protein LUH23_09490 [Oscillospiraceae bacterium]|nr:hypothetical protein [Oscillospiraceae bacterium]